MRGRGLVAMDRLVRFIVGKLPVISFGQGGQIGRLHLEGNRGWPASLASSPWQEAQCSVNNALPAAIDCARVWFFRDFAGSAGARETARSNSQIQGATRQRTVCPPPVDMMNRSLERSPGSALAFLSTQNAPSGQPGPSPFCNQRSSPFPKLERLTLQGDWNHNPGPP